MCKTRLPGTDKRGSAAARRASKRHLLATYGDGTVCPCVFCGITLTFETVTRDRIIPGSQGGTYRRDNLQPACLTCNSARQDLPSEQFANRKAA